MLDLLGILGYTLIGFGIGGITFKNHKYKEIDEEFGKFKIESENEIKQKDKVKDKYTVKAQDTIKENTELTKLYNRSVRNVELLQEQLKIVLQKLDFYTNGGPEKLVMKEEKEKAQEIKLIEKDIKLIEKEEAKRIKQENLKVKNEKAKLKTEDAKIKKEAKEKTKIEKNNNIKAAADLKAKIKVKNNLEGELSK